MADHICSLGMLIDLLREHDMIQAVRDHEGQQRGQRRQGIVGGWFVSPAVTRAKFALDRLSLGGLRGELERQGN
ncbi:hypothetical protein ColTof4_14007 [Colletotrichum tofieldiae]|nr:hypothetical protein ColTof3_14640 [Colletotrichum tofieldiae]GKT81584.1 hypothetical protein ColTof4_14007 [Colletotrichum tofieldiae]GKT97561.1 hypothetical protein Ct61P_15411 [Colletotrichum tofieldiae]